MHKNLTIIVAGDSTFSWELVKQLHNQVTGKLYFVLEDRELAIEASALENVVAVSGDLTDVELLEELPLDSCDIFVAGSKEERSNVLGALYAKNAGTSRVYARIFSPKLEGLLQSIGIEALLTSYTSASYTAVQLLLPNVAELVDLTTGQFDLIEIMVNNVPELDQYRLGDLEGKEFNVVAIKNDSGITVDSNAIIHLNDTLIVIYNRNNRGKIHQVLKNAVKK
ncbi:MAG: TrkA family potassium uptake protein [Anaerolineaceae bacterium]|nr:TrkA family potassium uptake protein [Anaerolineaceae bacterium]